MPVSAVIFDMDGVLVDSGPPHHESWRIVARKHELDVSAERFGQAFGRPSRDIIRLLWNRELSEPEVAEIDAEKEAIYRDLVRGKVPIIPGCRDALRRLSGAGLRIAVATSGPPENLALVLDEGELRALFAATVHGFEIRHGKPAPDCFLLAAQRLAAPPASCVVIEDSPVGVAAAVAAGMGVIGFAPDGGASRLREAGAGDVIAGYAALTPERVQSAGAAGV